MQHLRFDSSTICKGYEAAMQQAESMLHQNILVCQDNDLNHYVSKGVPQPRNCLLARDLVEDVSNACNVWAGSQTFANSKCEFATKG